jgi:hypothetical protein
MSRTARLVLWALSISFVGSLPLGTLNLGVVSYVSDHNVPGALCFSLAAIAVEMAIVGLVLIAVEKIEKLKHLYTLYNLLAFLLLLVFAFNIFASEKIIQSVDGELPSFNLHPAIAGLLLSIANPLHLPFWMGWTAVLRSKSILSDNRSSHSTFVIAIGVGTALAFLAYGVAGHYLAHILSQYQEWVNRAVGAAVLLAALMLLYKMLLKRRQTTKEHRQQHSANPCRDRSTASSIMPK